MSSSDDVSGFGDQAATIKVYIANRPTMAEYQQLDCIQPLQRGEIDAINQACGNGWRKVFNVYAKLLLALDTKQFPFLQQADTWQHFRDSYLLQAASNTALLFSAPMLSTSGNTVHIITGRSYAKTLLDNGLQSQLHWLNAEFAIDQHHRLLVCPYFDYRQLSNEKILYLAALIAELG